MPEKNSVKKISLLIAAISLLYILFIQFYKLGELPIVQWDESRLAVNAAEMYKNKNYFVTTFENKPDLYNTKPPFMIRLQTASIYLFGLNEYAIRFPSALAGFITIILCGFIVFKETGNLVYGCIAALILTVSNGFIQLHGSMTGDYDSLLSLFVLLGIFMYKKYVNSKSKKHLFLTFLYLSFAILSKSAAALLVIPVLIINSIFTRDRKTIFNTILISICACIPLIIFCGIREYLSPGYLQAIIDNDFIGRFSGAKEGHTSEWYYYIVNLFEFRFSYFIWLLPLALIAAIFYNSKALKYYALSFSIYFILLSVAKTRIHWYDMPVLPLIAILITIFIAGTVNQWRHFLQHRIAIIFCFAAILPLSFLKADFILKRKGLILDFTHYELSEMLRNYQGEKRASYIAAPYDAEFYFYTLSNPKIYRTHFNHLKTGEIVMYGNLYKDSINILYNYTTIDSSANAKMVLIRSIKKHLYPQLTH